VELDARDASVWVWRPLVAGPDGRSHTVVANLDAADHVRERSTMLWTLVGVDIALSALGALLGGVVARQLQQPISSLTRHLQASAGQRPSPIDARLIPERDPEMAGLMHAFNRMAIDARDRELLLERLIEQERDAVLGRMAATLAHEVRNPLGGIETAIRTLRRFGDQPEPRREALDFVERGVVALRDVADATLKTHRGSVVARPLERQDLADVGRLARAEADRRGVALEVDGAIGDAVPISATEVRQVLLNLLLNAVGATPRGGAVRLTASRDADEIVFEVVDEGPGPTPELRQRFAAGSGSPPHGGLGVAVIVRLVERLQGRVSIEAAASGGTRITLRVPIDAKLSP
jgi:signal transduction histidine kinase